MLKSQEAVISTMAACKKPANANFMIDLPKENKKKMIALEKTARAFLLHLRCL